MAVVDAWLAVCSQWRTLPLADGRLYWQGLDYAGVDVALRRSAIALDPARWTMLRLMESAAASVFNGVRG